MQCPRCDRGLHRRCLRLKHCTAKDRSPAGTNKREQGACARRASSPALIRLAEPMIARLRSCAARKVKRAFKAAVKKAKQAFHDGIDSWMRRLRFDHGSGPGGGGGLGGGDASLLA